jgi:hypothetical protein
MRLQLGWQATGQADDLPGLLPHALDLQRFLLSAQPSCERVIDGQCWTWKRVR